MNNDDVLAFMVENGLLSVRWQQPMTAHEPKPVNPTMAATVPYPLIKFRKGIISESELCEELGIKEDELFSYLVNIGELFELN